MSNEQACDGSRPACDAVVAQLAAAQARADAANDALLDTVADLSRYQAQSAEFERVYERELKRADELEARLKLIEPLVREEGKAMIARGIAERRADAAESRVRELEAERNGGTHYWRERDYKALLDIERLFKPEAESIELAPNPAINRIQAVISARDAAIARADAAEGERDLLMVTLQEAHDDITKSGIFGFAMLNTRVRVLIDKHDTEKARADALAQQVAKLRKFLQGEADNCPLCHGKGEFEFTIPNSTGTTLKVCGQCASVRQALARIDAQEGEHDGKYRTYSHQQG